MSVPSNPSNGDVITLGGSQYEYNSESNQWLVIRSKDVIALESRVDSELTNFRFNDLLDVNVSYPPEDNTVLSWDSDLQNWQSRQFTLDPLGAIAVKSQNFTCTENQTSFRLDFFPIGDVDFYRNGVQLSNNSYNLSGRVITYQADGNNNKEIDEGDKVSISYNYGTSIALTSELANLTDVDVTTTLPKEGEFLSWDSDSEKFKPFDLEPRLVTIEEDIQQVVSDRVYADNLLSNRLNDLDSDINARGSFYVQATPPTGSENSGWVNTTNMKLYVWDVVESTWVQIQIT